MAGPRPTPTRRRRPLPSPPVTPHQVFAVLADPSAPGRHRRIGGEVAGWTFLEYTADKAAVIHLTRCVAAELGQHGVRVNCISPSPTLTGIFARDAGIEPGPGRPRCRRARAGVPAAARDVPAANAVPDGPRMWRRSRSGWPAMPPGSSPVSSVVVEDVARAGAASSAAVVRRTQNVEERST
jgi:NAD(P)-dependent dehydrogenase (short-subunit alcohol dehydrogenase family)